MTIVVSFAVASIVSLTAFIVRRPRDSASAMAPTAPRAPASVGVAMPAKMLPRTTRISTMGGSMTTAT